MTTALYRRYRPETFAEVIGQDHVTAPLRQALRSGRVNHAYLFSGPRGCGKTTSARILARTLNCHRNTEADPLDTPCGQCPSCIELSRGGPGSLDVVEIDAASHNGVDDARDLRERATFAPARDRFKIFILDEAHMVTPQGFNALLKIVEEPPAHIKFVFATTEPDKVIGTIRSRTHHYPFRLVPPDVLGPYLDELCAAEGVQLGAGVVGLVTRAGGGSVRDTLSVLDQLIAGASGGVVEYDLAVGLLGYTHATLLDDVVDALAARDGASIFRVIDQIVATGHEPRRFVEDVLERLRDLIVLAVSGDAAEAVLRGLPTDQLERMHTQAEHLGVAELSRAADLVNAALTEMTGATSPRLHLELLCARLLLPGADDGTDGLAARIDRLERGAVTAGSGGAVAPGPAAGTTAASSPRTAPGVGQADHGPEGAVPESSTGLSGAAAARAALRQSRRPVPKDAPGAASSASAASVQSASAAASAAPSPDPQPAPTAPDEVPDEAAPEPEPAATDAAPAVEPVQDLEPPAADPVAEPAGQPGPSPEPAAAHEAAAPPAPAAGAQPAPEPSAELTAEVVRRRWDEVVANVASPVTRALVGPNAQVLSLSGDLLRLGFSADGMARTFSQTRHVEALADALYQTLGLQVRVEATTGAPGIEPAGHAGPEPDGPERADPPREPSTHRTEATPGAEQPRSRGPSHGAGADRGPAESGQADTPRPTRGTTGPDDGGWPTVVPPGRADGPAAPGAASGAQRQAVTPSGVALAEREDGAAEQSAAEVADAAWLAGTPAAASAASAQPAPPDQAASHQPASHQASPRPEPVPPSGTSRRDPVPPRRAETAPEPPPPGYDDASDDDPDIASTGLVGVPLVVKMLDGAVIDEVADQP